MSEGWWRYKRGPQNSGENSLCFGVGFLVIVALGGKKWEPEGVSLRQPLPSVRAFAFPP